jgi:serine/threonine protein kinase
MGGFYSKVEDTCRNLSRLIRRREDIMGEAIDTQSTQEGITTRSHIGYSPPQISKNIKFLFNSSSSKKFTAKPDQEKAYTDITGNCKHSLKSINSIQNKNKIEINKNRNFEMIIHEEYSFNTFPFDKTKRKTSEKKNYLLEDFQILRLLGKGTFGKVLLVRNKIDSKLYAMKVLKKYKLFRTKQIYHTKTEREILEKINHPFIVKLHFAFQTELKLYLITEFMQGGELFYHLKNEKFFNEEKMKNYFCEIFLALEHLHRNKIIYRDLKPENILLDVDGHIKLADFGLSKYFNNQSSSPMYCSLDDDSSSNISDKAFTLCGTPQYLAPEILTGQGYDRSVDWWSLGVLMYEMLHGHSPFKKRKDRLDFSFDTINIEVKDSRASAEAKDLILSLLKKDPNERLRDSSTIRLHPFLKNVNWEKIINKKTTPQYIPKLFLQCDEDLSCFDKNFTMASFSDRESESHQKNSNLNITSNTNKDLKLNEENKQIDIIRKIRQDFQNFSFTRDEHI